MPAVTIRNLPDATHRALKVRAAQHGRSAEAEHRLILEEALRAGRRNFRERAAGLRKATAGRLKGESADLIRADRDKR